MTEPVVHEMNNHTFRLAVAQFDRAAELMGLDHNLRQRLKMPDRSLVVSVPVRMDDGRVEVYTGTASSTIPRAGRRKAASGTIRM